MEELDLKELFNLFWNEKGRIILIILIFLMIGVIYTMWFVSPMYSSSTTLVLATAENSRESSDSTDDSITTTEITLNSKLVSTYSELIKSKNILREVISNLKIDVEEESLRKNIEVTSVKDTEIIEITVTNENANNSARVANEIAQVFADRVKELYNINNVHVVDKAEPNSNPSNINHVRDIAMFTLAGLIVAIGYVLIANMLDNTIKTAEDIEKQFAIPVLASVPLIDNFDSERGGKK